MSDEQRRQQVVQVAQAEAQPAETTGDRWGDPISEERQAELQDYLDRWQAETEAEHGERKGPFAGVPLTGADVFYLAARTLVGTNARGGGASPTRLEPGPRWVPAETFCW